MIKLPPLNRFEYLNKEKESTFNLRRISFGARTYNASIGRFDGVDPLADIAGRFSPFVYANNNPLVFVYPDGRASEDYTYSDGYSTLSAKNSTGSVGFSGAYQNCCNNQEPIKGGYPNGTLGPASQQNATVSQSKSNNFTPEEKAAHLGVDMASAVEGGVDLTKSGASFLRNGKNLFKTITSTSKELKIVNSVPTRLARVIPANINTKTLGAPGEADVFVTAADDIVGLNANQIAKRLSIPNSSSGFRIVEFNTPATGLASPIKRTNPGFVGFGRTQGGTREFVIPNQVIPKSSTIRIVK